MADPAVVTRDERGNWKAIPAASSSLRRLALSLPPCPGRGGAASTGAEGSRPAVRGRCRARRARFDPPSAGRTKAFRHRRVLTRLDPPLAGRTGRSGRNGYGDACGPCRAAGGLRLGGERRLGPHREPTVQAATGERWCNRALPAGTSTPAARRTRCRARDWSGYEIPSRNCSPGAATCPPPTSPRSRCPRPRRERWGVR